MTIHEALRTRYSPPEWHIAFEITLERRRLDALALNVWRRRVVAFEIKVSKADLMRELADWTKSERAVQTCDSFYLVTPKGLADGVDLPSDWGWLETRGERLYTRKQPAERRNHDGMMHREIACRLVARVMQDLDSERYRLHGDARDEIRRELQETMKQNHDADRVKAAERLAVLEREHAEILEAMGIRPGEWERHRKALETAGMFRQLLGGVDTLGALRRLSDKLDERARSARSLLQVLEEDARGEVVSCAG